MTSSSVFTGSYSRPSLPTVRLLNAASPPGLWWNRRSRTSARRLLHLLKKEIGLAGSRSVRQASLNRPSGLGGSVRQHYANSLACGVGQLVFLDSFPIPLDQSFLQTGLGLPYPRRERFQLAHLGKVLSRGRGLSLCRR